MLTVGSIEEAEVYAWLGRWAVLSRSRVGGQLTFQCVRNGEPSTLEFELQNGEVGADVALRASSLISAGGFAQAGAELVARVPRSPLGFVREEVARCVAECELAAWALRASLAATEGAEVRGALEAVLGRLAVWRVALAAAPQSRSLADLPLPPHGFMPPEPIGRWLARAAPFPVTEVPPDLRVVARAGDGRFLVRHAAHTLAWLRVDRPAGASEAEVRDIQALTGRAALGALLEWGFDLLELQAAALVGPPGEPLAALAARLAAGGRARDILEWRTEGERVRLVEIEVQEPRYRGSLLVVRLDDAENVLGTRLVGGIAGYEMMGLADATAPHLPGPAGERPPATVQAELAEKMKEIAAAVQPLLEALVHPAQGAEALEAVRPRPGDAALVFTGDPARIATIEEAYARLWSSDPPRVRAGSAAVSLRIHVAPAGMLGPDSGAPMDWPVPYLRIAGELVPSRTWVAWSYLPVGGGRGNDYDGLVWLGDRWVWFPAPWRVLPRIAAYSSAVRTN